MVVVTMKDLAEKAGVSVVTVSRALNDKPDINPRTKEMILRLARESNFSPHALARSLVTKKTKTIGIIIPSNTDAFYAEVVGGISQESRERGYSVILSTSHDSADEELNEMRMLFEKRVDGMLVYPAQEDDRYIEVLRNSPIPFVFLNRHVDQLNCDYVINDNVYGAHSAVDHLLKNGYRDITYICAKPTASSGRERILGCRQAFNENGIDEELLDIVTCDETIKCCYDFVLEALQSKRKMDAIFAWDDRLAIGVIKALLESGVRIPEDIAVVGYDDIEISAYLYPPLTTVQQPTFQIGERATRILLDKLESDRDTGIQQIVLKPKLIVRGTT